MLRESSGRIVNMGSMADPIGRARPLRRFKARSGRPYRRTPTNLRPFGIRVSLVEPGVVKTGIWDKSIDAAEKSWRIFQKTIE